ncbi:hypothetical protein ID866_13348 [Astraeus odoratus]|nr:hypothetical protein ID866_13348 [Astraeus odoratus]
MHSLVEASSAKRGLKSDPLPDDRLTWEQFFEATPCMIRFMVCYQWPQDCIDMFGKLWLNIQSHPWRTSTDPFAKKALLSYQAKQHCIWHYSIGMPCGFSLAEIEEEVLKRTQDELAHSSFNAELSRMQAINNANMAHQSRPNSVANPLTASTRCPWAPTTTLPGNPSDSLDKHPRFRPSSPSRAFLPATPSTDGTPPPVLSVCPICLSQEKHKIVECNASLTWDKQFETICKHFNKLLLTHTDDWARILSQSQPMP